MLYLAVLLLYAAPEFQSFDAPGYSAPVSGVWYEAGEASSPIPLGALGTGFVGLQSDGRFGETTAENSWLRPMAVGPRSGLELTAGGRHVDLRANSKGTASGLRFWGHYPAADLTFGDSLQPLDVRVRAFAPLIPHDYACSQMPAVLLHVAAANRGTDPVPLDLRFHWDLNTPPPDRSEGNVEAVIGWRKDLLPPGEAWVVAPILVFADGPDELAKAAATVHRGGTPLKEGTVNGARSYAYGDIQDFYLDAVGGFSWPVYKKESSVFRDAPTIGQLMWQLQYKGGRAGRGPNKAYGILAESSSLSTSDGKLSVNVSAEAAGDNAIAVVYTFVNRSEETLQDLSMSFAANVDIGGPGKENQGKAQWDPALCGVRFESTVSSTTVALMGNPDEYLVSTWPLAHEAMDFRTLVAVNAASPPQDETAVASGRMGAVRGGTYAVGASGSGWSIEPDSAGDGVLTATAHRDLQPGESGDLYFALAWHFPTWKSTDREPETLRHRYAKDFADAGAVLETALQDAEHIEQSITAWQGKVYAANAPAALKDAAINSLYVLARNSWWIDDGRFFQSESFTGCPITETLVCRFNGSFPLALLFPECERATMREFARTQAESGQIAFGFGDPASTRTPMMHLQIPIVSSEYALLVWRNYALWKDDAYLAEAYPSMKRAIQFAMTLDTDGDGLVNDAPGSETGFPANQYYDIWPWWGTSAYTSSIWLAAMKAGIAAAEKQGDAAFASEVQGWFDRGAAAYNEKLWTGEYYRLYSGTEGHDASDTSLTNALCGQWFAYAAGLGELVPRERIDSVVSTVLRLNAKATAHGAVNGVKPDGTVDESFKDHSAVITIGEVWNFCAMAAFAGHSADALALFDVSYGGVALNHRTPWNIPWSLDRDTGAIKWGIHYYSNPCVWTLLQALDPEVYAGLGRAG